MTMGSLLRMLDANANRAREALRVVEDYARFVLDDDGLSAELKAIRHDLAGAVGPLLPEAILWRDTAGDVGTDNKTAAEGRREDLAAVVTAAGKRLGEALRVIEEVLKTEDLGGSPNDEARIPNQIRSPKSEAEQKQAATQDSELRTQDSLSTQRSALSTSAPSDRVAASARVEALRYRFYTVEQRIARTLGRGARFADVRLYVLITESVCRRPWIEAAEQAILGGADCLQLREKDLPSGELFRRARQLVALCRRHGVLCIINDRADIAVLSGADGVHVGQEDLPAVEARKIIGPEKILGVSTHRIEQARQAVLDGADYIGAGPIYRSSTKPRDFVAGLDYAQEVAASINIPAVAIAGIDEANVEQVCSTGVKAVAVTAAVVGQPDIRAAAERIKRKINGCLDGRGPRATM